MLLDTEKMNLHYDKPKSKRKKAYSLAEVIISLAIIGVILTILFNALIIAIRVTNKTLARSIVREEVSEVTTLISRDIRNADTILNCGSITEANQTSCDMVLNGSRVSWSLCGTSVCKRISENATEQGEVSYQSSEILSVTSFNFELGLTTTTDSRKSNILFTMVGNHSNERLNITNVVRQVSISTRNYSL